MLLGLALFTLQDSVWPGGTMPTECLEAGGPGPHPSYLGFALAVTGFPGGFITPPLHGLQKTPKRQQLLGLNESGELKKALITSLEQKGAPRINTWIG